MVQYKKEYVCNILKQFESSRSWNWGFNLVAQKILIYLDESVSSGPSTSGVTPSSPNDSRNNFPPPKIPKRGRPKGSKNRGGAPRPKRQKIDNAVTNGENSVESGT